MASHPPHMPTPNTAFKRKPIPVNITPPTPIASRIAPLPESSGDSPCPRCGADSSTHTFNQSPRNLSLGNEQARICELEAEVRILTGKATTAADKVADYEEELQKLRALRSLSPQANEQSQPINTQGNTSPIPQSVEGAVQAPAPTSSQPAAPVRPAMPLGRALTTTRLTNFLSARRQPPQASSPLSPSDAVTASPIDASNAPLTADLTARLNVSETARRNAEDKLSKTNAELEELSVSLFSQANEMVANERIANAEREAQALERENTARDQEKAREQKAKEREVQWQEWQSEMKARDKVMQQKVKRLEARVKTLEERDKEKGKRLERLESALTRTGRIRGLLDVNQNSGRG